MHGGIHLGETGLALHVGGDLYDVILEGSGFTVHRCPGAFLSRTPRAGAAPMPPRPAQGQAVGRTAAAPLPLNKNKATRRRM